jgi:hypothetical protein
MQLLLEGVEEGDPRGTSRFWMVEVHDAATPPLRASSWYVATRIAPGTYMLPLRRPADFIAMMLFSATCDCSTCSTQ